MEKLTDRQVKWLTHASMTYDGFADIAELPEDTSGILRMSQPLAESTAIARPQAERSRA